MNCASRASLESESNSDRSVESGIGWLFATKGVVSVNGAAGDLSNFGVELQKQKVHRQIAENVRPRQVLRNRDRTGVRGGSWGHSASRNVRTHISRGVVLVLTDAGREAEEDQALAGGKTPGLGFETEVVDVE